MIYFKDLFYITPQSVFPQVLFQSDDIGMIVSDPYFNLPEVIMATALVVNENHGSSQNLIDILHRQYANWEMTYVDKYEDAIEKIQTEAFDVMTLDSHLSSKHCQKLADTLHEKQPDAKIYIAMKDPQIKTDYSRIMNRGLILIPAS